MRGDDERQSMIATDFEIYEKFGVPTGALQMHYHDFYEIIYIAEGEFSSLVNNVTYHLHKGDFLLLDRNVMHNYHYVEGRHENSRRIVLWISPDTLESLSGGLTDLSACFHHPGIYAYHFPIYYEEMLRNLLVKIALEEAPDMQLEGGKKLLDRVNLTQFFLYLNELSARKSFSHHPRESTRHSLVERVSVYMDEHLDEDISVEELAKHLHLSKFYLLHRFKELTGTTLHAFLTDKRLIRACEYLQSELAIGEIGNLCGFNDYSVFLRNFKKAYDMSPREYRDLFHNQKPLANL